MTTLTQWQHYLQFKKKISDNINDILSNINRHAKIFYNKKKRLVCLWLIIPFVLNLSFLAHVSRKWFRSGCESGIHLTLHFLRAVHTTDFQWIRDGNETESGNIITLYFLLPSSTFKPNKVPNIPQHRLKKQYFQATENATDRNRHKINQAT